VAQKPPDGTASADCTADLVLYSSDWVPPEGFWKARADAAAVTPLESSAINQWRMAEALRMAQPVPET